MHFKSSKEEGTGLFSALEEDNPVYPPPDPETPELQAPKKWVKLRTKRKTKYERNYGRAYATYTAGKYGIKETLKASILESFDANESIGTKKDGFDELLITVPGLAKIDKSRTMSADGKNIVIEGGYKSACDKQHNAEALDRYSDYLTEPAMKGLVSLDQTYYKETGEHLCLNDASLIYGGFYDNGKADQKGCHKGHLRGIGIDINNTGKYCASVLKKSTTTCSLYVKNLPKGVTREEFWAVYDLLTLEDLRLIFGWNELITKAKCLELVAEELDIYKVPEKSGHIHYRMWPD